MAKWDPMPGESMLEYKRFLIYRDMGEDRSMRAVAKLCGVLPSAIYRVSGKNRWNERVRGYDERVEESVGFEDLFARAVERIDRAASGLMDNPSPGEAVKLADALVRLRKLRPGGEAVKPERKIVLDMLSDEEMAALGAILKKIEGRGFDSMTGA